MLSEWDKNSDGNITVNPVLRYRTATLYDMAVGLRLELARDQVEPQKNPLIVQAALTVEQAEDLIGLLQMTIDAVQAPRPSEPSH